MFADGEVDRSPTGTGVSARAALHFSNGELEIGESLIIESILGTTMNVELIGEVDYGPYRGVIPKVSGEAYITGMHEFLLDPNDPLRHGFILR